MKTILKSNRKKGIVSITIILAILFGTISVEASEHPTIYRGCRGEAVVEFQRDMNEIFALDIDEDGVWGQVCDNACELFQVTFGLKADRICGPATWRKIDECLSKNPNTGKVYGVYKIRNMETGYVLKAVNGNLVFGEDDGSLNSLFQISYTEHCRFITLCCMENGQYITVEGDAGNGVNLSVTPPTNKKDQMFGFWGTNDGTGSIWIVSSINSKYVMDAERVGDTVNKNANAQLWIEAGGNNQKMYLEKVECANDKAYKATEGYDDRTMDVSSYEAWKRSYESAVRGVTGFYTYRLSFNDGESEQIYKGKVITDKKVLEWKTISVQVPAAYGPNAPSKTMYVCVPAKVRFYYHKHDYQHRNTVKSVGVTMVGVASGKFVYTYECSCGNIYGDSISLPDFPGRIDIDVPKASGSYSIGFE